MAAILFIVGGALLVAGNLTMWEEWRFTRDGVSTDGTVLTKQVTPARTYEATYRFMVPEGVFESRERLSYDAWSRLKEHGAIEVVYLPSRPRDSRIAGSQHWTSAVATALLGCLFCVAGIVRSTASRRA